MHPPEISVDEALQLHESKAAVFVDVRDPGSWRAGHIPGALHVNDHNIQAFIEGADRQRTTVVYCYHGNSSMGGAAYLLSEGFAEVYSMTGGFAEWEDRPTEEAAPEPAPRDRSSGPGRPSPARAAPERRSPSQAPVQAAPTRPEPPRPARDASTRPSRRSRWLRRLRSLGGARRR